MLNGSTNSDGMDIGVIQGVPEEVPKKCKNKRLIWRNYERCKIKSYFSYSTSGTNVFIVAPKSGRNEFYEEACN